MIKAALAALIIHSNGGGNVIKFAHQIEHQRAPVEIRGLCASACTMYLSLKNVCVTPDAPFMFHAAYDVPGSTEHTGPRDPAYTKVLMSYYPKPLQTYLNLLGGLTIRKIWMRGSDLIKIGAAKPCAEHRI